LISTAKAVSAAISIPPPDQKKAPGIPPPPPPPQSVDSKSNLVPAPVKSENQSKKAGIPLPPPPPPPVAGPPLPKIAFAEEAIKKVIPSMKTTSRKSESKTAQTASSSVPPPPPPPIPSSLASAPKLNLSLQEQIAQAANRKLKPVKKDATDSPKISHSSPSAVMKSAPELNQATLPKKPMTFQEEILAKKLEPNRSVPSKSESDVNALEFKPPISFQEEILSKKLKSNQERPQKPLSPTKKDDFESQLREKLAKRAQKIGIFKFSRC
jgi:hypothetical protein